MFLLGVFFSLPFLQKGKKRSEKRKGDAEGQYTDIIREKDGPRIKLKVELLFPDWENKQECLERRGLGRIVHKAGVQTLDGAYPHTACDARRPPARVQIEHVNTLMVAKTPRYLTPVQILHNGDRKGAARVSEQQIARCAISFIRGTVHLKTRRGSDGADSAGRLTLIPDLRLLSFLYILWGFFCRWGLSMLLHNKHHQSNVWTHFLILLILSLQLSTLADWWCASYFK